MAHHERPPPRRRRGRVERFSYGFAVIWSWLWCTLTIAVLFAAIPEWLGIVPVPAEDIEGGIIAAVICVAMTGGGLLLVRLVRDAPPRALPPAPPRVEAPKHYRLPRPGSAARTPMRRLTEAETALTDLLRRLRDVRSELADDVVEHTSRVAADAAAGLRSIAARVEAVELAAEHSPADKQVALTEAAGSLLAHIEQGLDAYRGLIAAAGLLVANTPALATDELVEATESLAGLAEGLRELSEE